MRLTGDVQRVSLLIIVIGGLAACEAPPGAEAAGGVVTLDVQPRRASVPGLALDLARMRLDRVGVFGDAPPPEPPREPVRADLDALSSGVSFTFTLPQGLYSRVRFSVGQTTLAGTWRGTPFAARLGTLHGDTVDLRSPGGRELAPGQDVTFAVTVDATSWFTGDLLDRAAVRDGRIVIDPMNEPIVAEQLLDRITHSFAL